jgi:hypothetical protein
MNVVACVLLSQIASLTPIPAPTRVPTATVPYVVVLRDGTKYQAQAPYTSKGSTALLKLLNGQLVSLRLESIDPEKTRVANIVLQPPATVISTPAARKARITLTDKDLPSVPTPDPRSVPPGPLAFSGSGPEITRLFPLDAGLVVFQLRHSGDRNFIVHLLDASGKSIDLLVNRIGDFAGSKGVRIPRSGQYTLNIEADGTWSIAVGGAQ